MQKFSNRYRIRDFTLFFNSKELSTDSPFIRAYLSNDECNAQYEDPITTVVNARGYLLSVEQSMKNYEVLRYIAMKSGIGYLPMDKVISTMKSVSAPCQISGRDTVEAMKRACNLRGHAIESYFYQQQLMDNSVLGIQREDQSEFYLLKIVANPYYGRVNRELAHEYVNPK